MKKIIIWIFIIISLGCHRVEPKKEIIIFHAGSLSAPMKRMEEEFENRFPNIDILREAAGSKRCARMIRDLKKPCDIIISSDYLLIDELLIPGYADWNILFASNEMVLAYTDKSRFADRISKDNWFEVLSRREVVWGYSDPDLDPCGYRALLVLELAEDHYQRPGLYRDLIDNCPKRNIRPKEVELISLLQTGNMDYAWEYRSVAVQHGLRFIELPEEINLSNPEYDKSITYGLTLIKGAPNGASAVLFLRFFLSPEGGLKILKEMGQPPCIPPLVKPGLLARLPEELKPLVTAAE